MISDRVRFLDVLPNRSPRYLIWLRPGIPGLGRILLFADQPSEQHGLPLVTSTVEWMRRCEIVGVKVC